MRSYFAASALLPSGWASGVRIEVDDRGDIARALPGAEPHGAELLDGVVVPGMPNVHSHGFQRGMAGLAERLDGSEEDFWSWRKTMYGFVARLTPGQVAALSAQAYVEMLKGGYTSVVEFHYLHHQTDGRPYSDRAEISRRVIGAALEAGIGITHLPALYAYSGFGELPPADDQRRFLNEPEGLMRIVEALRGAYGSDPRVRVGAAPHSLRAVSPGMFSAMVEGVRGADPRAPVHVHVAEQEREVRECLDWSGRRPVEYLLDQAPVGEGWCLVHATHASRDELQALARSGAVVALCPTTEANLGDGIFPLPEYLEAGGRFGIGSDSNVCLDPAEELRWLDYVQRLTRRSRRPVRPRGARSLGAALYREALEGGRQASGRAVGRIERGSRADLVVLDPDDPGLAGRAGDLALDAWVYAPTRRAVRHVMAGGEWLVRDGHHLGEDAIADRFRAVMDELAP